MTFRSALYDGDVVHERVRPKAHRLRYRVFSMLFDLDELPALDARLAFFAHNRWAPVAFHDRDHGARDGGNLRAWAETRMREAGVMPDGGAIQLLCYPRLFGYVFNPLSVYFCRDKTGALSALLYEVHNTHGEQHTYAIAVTDDARVIQQRAEKAFFVSPFIGPSATYNFKVVPPAETVSVVIREEDAEGVLMTASFTGAHQPLTGKTLAQHVLRFPLMTFKVMAAIHWEALKLVLKGFKIFPHTPQAADTKPGPHS